MEMKIESINKNNLTITEAGAYLAVSDMTIRRWIKLGKIKSKKSINKRIFIPMTEIMRIFDIKIDETEIQQAK